MSKLGDGHIDAISQQDQDSNGYQHVDEKNGKDFAIDGSPLLKDERSVISRVVTDSSGIPNIVMTAKDVPRRRREACHVVGRGHGDGFVIPCVRKDGRKRWQPENGKRGRRRIANQGLSDGDRMVSLPSWSQETPDGAVQRSVAPCLLVLHAKSGKLKKIWLWTQTGLTPKAENKVWAGGSRRVQHIYLFCTCKLLFEPTTTYILNRPNFHYLSLHQNQYSS